MQRIQGEERINAPYIRQKSIRFLTEKDIVELKKIQLIAAYLNTRWANK